MWIKSSKDRIDNLTIRRLSHHDQLAVTEHFERLDQSARRMRFGFGTSDEFVRRYAKRALQIDGTVYGAFTDGKLLGVAELRDHFDLSPSTAEAALSVEPKWQDRGIGNALLNRIIVAAKDQEIKTLHMICLQENEKMRHLAAKHHVFMEFFSRQVEATIQPAKSREESALNKVTVFVNAILRLSNITQHKPIV